MNIGGYKMKRKCVLCNTIVESEYFILIKNKLICDKCSKQIVKQLRIIEEW